MSAGKQFRISKASYSEAMAWLEEALEAPKVSRKEMLIAEFLLEENFLRMAAASGKPESFSAEISLHKRLGDVNLLLIAKGEPHNPIVELDENSDDENERYVLASLKAYRQKMSYVRRQGCNIVSIQVHESSNKQMYHMLLGMAGGILLGLVLKSFLGAEALGWIEHNIFSSVETLFMSVLQMMIAPMIFLSVVSGILSISNAADVGRMGGKMMVISVAKLVFALGIAALLGSWLGATPELVETAEMGTVEASTPSLRDLLLGIVPKNVVTPFASNNLLQILFISCFFGLLLVKSGERLAWMKETIASLYRLAMDAIGVIMPFMPLVVAASMAKLMMSVEISALLVYVWFIGAIFLGCFLMLLVSGLFVAVIGRISPVAFLKKTASYSLLPFNIRSSNACIPQTLEFCAAKLGIDEKLAMFAIPVGIQFNMIGGGMYAMTAAILMRLTLGLPFNMEFLLSFFFAALLVTFTFPCVPGSTVLALASIFEMAGVPAGAITLFIGIDPLVAGIRAVGNTASNVTTSFLLARLEGKVQEDVYYAE